MTEVNPDEAVPEEQPAYKRASIFRNWISLSGVIVAFGSLFAFMLLFAIDMMTGHSNPYMGILAYLVAPVFLVIGTSLLIVGAVIRRSKIARATARGELLPKEVQLTRRRYKKDLVLFAVGASIFLLLTAIGSYQTYHFTESVVFCGQACHEVMKPEFVTYMHSPHARVSCSECHIGSGANWYVKSKISGAYQVYATAFDKYPRPIKTPISNLRPAQETCEQCHWPPMYVGNLDRTYNHFLADKENTPYSVRLSLKVGGGDATQGPIGGIHWHMNVNNKIEYYAADKQKQNIPWVRVTNPQGVVTVYRTEEFQGEPEASAINVMDCMDCHNRPAHIFKSPNDAVDLAMSVGILDSSLPALKRRAVEALTAEYATETEASQKIATELNRHYGDDPRVGSTIDAVQQIYSNNFFPEMKANWQVYPNNIGHKDWLGCFRCHDGLHSSADGLLNIKADDCNACHTIIAQGKGEELNLLAPKGLEFDHPDGDFLGLTCSDCHTGALQ